MAQEKTVRQRIQRLEDAFLSLLQLNRTISREIDALETRVSTVESNPGPIHPHTDKQQGETNA